MRNRIKCKSCYETIESTHRHDFVTCKCGLCSTDGGKDYQRIVIRSDKSEDFHNSFWRIDDEGKEIEPKHLEEK